jgi:hypothetical protein
MWPWLPAANAVTLREAGSVARLPAGDRVHTGRWLSLNKRWRRSVSSATRAAITSSTSTPMA